MGWDFSDFYKRHEPAKGVNPDLFRLLYSAQSSATPPIAQMSPEITPPKPLSWSDIPTVEEISEQFPEFKGKVEVVPGGWNSTYELRIGQDRKDNTHVRMRPTTNDGIEVAVVIDGKPLREFGIPYDPRAPGRVWDDVCFNYLDGALRFAQVALKKDVERLKELLNEGPPSFYY